MPARAHRLELIPPYLFAEISRIKHEAIAQGADIIDLGIGDPDLPTPEPIIDALSRSAHDPRTHRYDETPRGWNSFLEAAAGWYRREFGVEVDPKSEVLQLIGSKEGLAHLAWTYIEPGDLSIVPNPGYTVYKVNTLMAGGEVFETPLRSENGFLPVLEDIPSDVARKAKLFYVCYPHNPTGATAPLSFYEDCVCFCREHDILLVNDMAYAAVTYDGYRCPTVLQVPGAKDVSIEFHSLSKTFNMTGWRLGFALGNKDAIANLSALKSNLDSKAFPAIAEAGAYGLNNLKIDETLRIFERRRDLLCDGLNALGWKVTKPKATFYVWARIPDIPSANCQLPTANGSVPSSLSPSVPSLNPQPSTLNPPKMTSAEFATELLKRAHIVAIPGSAYGSEGEGYIRMSLTLLGDKDGERFAEAVRRIKESGLLPVGV